MITTSRIDDGAYYPFAEAAETVGMTYDELYEARRKGALEVVTKRYTNRRLFVRGSELRRFVESVFTEA